MAQRQSSYWHDEIYGREQQGFPGHADKIEENGGELVQRMRASEDDDASRANELQHTRDNGDNKQADAQEKNEYVGHYGGHEEMPPSDGDPVEEDHRHRDFQHCECERAEEEHRDNENAAHELSMREEGPQFLDLVIGPAPTENYALSLHGALPTTGAGREVL